MGAAQTDRGSALEKWSLSALSVLGAVLIGAAIWSLVRALSISSVETGGPSVPQDAAAPARAAAVMKGVLSQKEIDRQHAQYQPPAPVIPKPIAVPAVVLPPNKNNAAIILQQEKVKVNQRLVKRLKRYVQEHPGLDTGELEEQIQKRENQNTPVP